METIETISEEEDFAELNRNIEAREEINTAAKDFYNEDIPSELVEIIGMPSSFYPGHPPVIHEAREGIDEAAKDFYSGDIPTETIEIVGMPSNIYPGDHTQIHEVSNTDFGRWICDAVKKASDEGRFPEALQHYASQIKGSEVFDGGTEAYLLQLAAEVYKNRFDDALVEKGRRQILEFAGKLKVIRRDK